MQVPFSLSLGGNHQTANEDSYQESQIMRYVVITFATEQGPSPEEIYIFPNHIDHDRFAESLSTIRRTKPGRPHSDWEREYAQVVSAGFTDGLRCWGESMTLGVKSRPDKDSSLIK